MQILEIKYHLDGRVERFVCAVVELTSGRAILRYVGRRHKPLTDGPLYLPAGEFVTLAFFWEGRHYLIYKLLSPSGKLLGHRFDICEDVRITQATIHWKDLVLDLWVDPFEQIHVLDEDEVEEHKARGLLSPQQLNIIQETKGFLLEHYREVLDEIARISS
jgi:hypothetical protein